MSPKPAFIGLACSAPMLKSGITTWFIFSCMTTALGVGFMGSSSVAGAWRPRNGGGSECRGSPGGSGSTGGGATSIILSTNTSLITSTGRSTNTSLIISTGLSMKTSLTTSTAFSTRTSLIISLGGC